MCPLNTPGIRKKRDDLGCVVSATGVAFPDHTITTCINTLQEESECVPLYGLTVRLLGVGKRCCRDGCRDGYRIGCRDGRRFGWPVGFLRG